MALFKQIQLARHLGTSKQAISKAVKSGKLVLNPQRLIDDTVPVNSVYIEQKLTDLPLSDHGDTNYRILQQPNISNDELAAARMNARDLVAKGKEIDNKIKTVKFQREKIKYYEDIGKSIPVSVIARGLSKVSSVINEQFGLFSDRNSSYLYSIAQSDDETKFREKLDSYIQESLEVVISNVSKTVSKYKETVENGEKDG